MVIDGARLEVQNPDRYSVEGGLDHVFAEIVINAVGRVGGAVCVCAATGGNVHRPGPGKRRPGRLGWFYQGDQSSPQNPKDPEVFYYSYFKRCEAYIWKGQFKTALDDCNRSIRALPEDYGYAYAARGRVFALLGQPLWALEDFNVAINFKSARSGSVKDSTTVIAYAGQPLLNILSRHLGQFETRKPLRGGIY